MFNRPTSGGHISSASFFMMSFTGSSYFTMNFMVFSKPLAFTVTK